MVVFIIIIFVVAIIALVVARLLNLDLRGVMELLKDIWGYIITGLVVIIFFVFVITVQPVAGNSMYPVLEEGDVIVCSKLLFNRNNIKRNQIVVLKAKDNKSFVKRVIGLPGEKIHYLNGRLYIDDRPYDETFLDKDTVTNNFMFEDICSIDDCPNGVIPDDMFLVMGDNRPNSEDSRTKEFGLVPRKNIKGGLMFRLWPITKFGTVE